jgi:predicted O-methyltransferase YrrM
LSAATASTGRIVQPHADTGIRTAAEKWRSLSHFNPRLMLKLAETRFLTPRDNDAAAAFKAYRDGRDFRFSYDFVSNNIPYVAPLLRAFAKAHGPDKIRYLEIGAYEGLNLTFMDWLLPGRLAVTAIDPWFDETLNPHEKFHAVQDRFHHNIALTGHRALDARKAFSGDVLPVMREAGVVFDLIYVDGSHTALDVMIDLCFCASLLRVGGMMILDDYWHDISDVSGPGVKQAVDNFLAIFHAYFSIKAVYRQVVLVKTAPIPR